MPRKSNIQVAKETAIQIVQSLNKKIHQTTSAKYIRNIIDAVKIDKVNNIISELNAIKSGSTAEAFRKSQFEKAETKRQEKIELSKKQILDSNIIKQNTVTMTTTANKNFTFLTHEMQIRRVRRETQQNKNILFSHQVKYYLDNVFNPEISNITFFTIDEIKKPLFDKISFRNSSGGSENGWLPKIEIKFYPNRVKVEFITTAYKQIDSQIYKSVYGEQLYQFNDSGTCVYDAFYNFFENKHIKSPKDKKVKAIFNKLITQKDKYAKAYTDKNIHEIAQLCSTKITIVDLINRENKIFNDNARNYYNIELINSKYNHLELLKDPSDYIEVDKEKYNEIKNESKFYIERMGKLITPNQTYSIVKSQFRTIYDEWKQQTNYNSYYIHTNSDASRFIQNYDYTLHTFFDNSMIINNDLYSEIDQKKAYYNCTIKKNNNLYVGFPSGSFITVSNITNQQFTEMTNNNLIGFFECLVVSHIKNSYHSDFIGFSIGSKHILTTVQILFLQQYIQFDFINACYSPSVDIPFNEKFLEKEDDISHYCKAFGLMLHQSCFTETKIKPYNQDLQYYKIINNETKKTYQLDDGTIKIIDNIDEPKNYIHFAYFMNSYCKTQNLKVMYENDIDQIIGVKVDSIVYKKNYNIVYDKSIFRPKETKIDFLAEESNIPSTVSIDLPKNNIKNNFDIDLDFGIEDDNQNIIDNTSTYGINYGIYSFFRSYFIEKSNNINFGSSFLQTGEIITNRIILINGPGGCGKTFSIINSGINQKNILYTSYCWNLIQEQLNKTNNNIIGSSSQKILGIKCEPMRNNNIKYVIIDELTLMNIEDIEKICDLYKHAFIFLIGDVEKDGFFYQCSVDKDLVIVPDEFNYKLQIVKYTKSYRFNEELNNRLNLLRSFMYENKDNYLRNILIKEYVYKNFSECLKNKEDIIFSDNDIGISGTNDLGEKSDGLSSYFINEKNVKPHIFVKKTDIYKGLLKGRRLASIPDHTNYELKLFKTIHSFQGLDLDHDNKIIIGIKNNFDYNLFYTALSRARRVDQINIITNV